MDDPNNEIRQFVIDNFLFGQPLNGLRDEDSFLEHGIIDSTGVLELIAFVESTYNIKFENEDLVPGNLDSIANVAAFIAGKRAVVVERSVAPAEGVCR